MANVKELYDYLDKKIPRALSCEWDNDGLMVCADAEKSARRVLLALDATDEVAKYAAENGFDAVVTHHPMIFSPLRALNTLDPTAKKALFFAKNDIAVMSFHTRLDALDGGVNDTLAEKLGVENAVPSCRRTARQNRLSPRARSLQRILQESGIGSFFPLHAGDRREGKRAKGRAPRRRRQGFR